MVFEGSVSLLVSFEEPFLATWSCSGPLKKKPAALVEITDKMGTQACVSSFFQVLCDRGSPIHCVFSQLRSDRAVVHVFIHSVTHSFTPSAVPDLLLLWRLDTATGRGRMDECPRQSTWDPLYSSTSSPLWGVLRVNHSCFLVSAENIGTGLFTWVLMK